MDINKINKLYDLIRKIIENKEAVIKNIKNQIHTLLLKYNQRLVYLKRRLLLLMN